MTEPVERPIIKTFIEEDGSTYLLLQQIAEWFNEPGTDRVLIGMWSVPFGEAWQLCVQVVATDMVPGDV